MNRSDIEDLLEFEGWLHLLTQLDPQEVEDEAISEALESAQHAFQVLKSAIHSGEDDEFFKDQYGEDLEDDDVSDVLKELNFDENR